MYNYEKYLLYKIKYLELKGGTLNKCRKNQIYSSLPDIKITVHMIDNKNKILRTVEQKIKTGTSSALLFGLLFYIRPPLFKKFTPRYKPTMSHDINGIHKINDKYKLDEDQTIYIKENVK